MLEKHAPTGLEPMAPAKKLQSDTPAEQGAVTGTQSHGCASFSRSDWNRQRLGTKTRWHCLDVRGSWHASMSYTFVMGTLRGSCVDTAASDGPVSVLAMWRF